MQLCLFGKCWWAACTCMVLQRAASWDVCSCRSNCAMRTTTAVLAHAVSLIPKCGREWPRRWRHRQWALNDYLCLRALSYRFSPLSEACHILQDATSSVPAVWTESYNAVHHMPFCHWQVIISDREQEVMGAAGLLTIGGNGGVGRGTLERTLRVTPGENRSGAICSCRLSDVWCWAWPLFTTLMLSMLTTLLVLCSVKGATGIGCLSCRLRCGCRGKWETGSTCPYWYWIIGGDKTLPDK